MELNLTKNLTNRQKIILEGVVRSSLFLIAMREFSLFIGMYITIPVVGGIFNAINLIFNKSYAYLTKNIVLNGFMEGLVFIIAFLSLFFICIVSSTYIIAKLCGLFKYFSKFKFFKSFLMLLIISIILYYFYILNLNTLKLNYNAVKDTEAVYTIIPSYLVYLFFNFLTKKFPTPFKQIGYFFSIEFYKDLYKKAENKFKTSD